MPRKTVDFTVTTEGRDKGKLFRITELPSSQAERWGLRAFNIMSKSLGGFPPSMLGAGMQGLTAIGISALVPREPFGLPMAFWVGGLVYLFMLILIIGSLL